MSNDLSNLRSVSWQTLTDLLMVYGEQLINYQEVAKTFKIDLPITSNSIVKVVPRRQKNSLEYDFIRRFILGIQSIYAQVDVVNREISRRNKLIGVMG